MSKFVTRLLNDESGATAIEYGLIAAGIGLVIISGIATLAGGLNGLFADIDAAL